jgi:hypothetical protein
MRKIKISDYEISIMTAEGEKTVPYLVRISLVNTLFHPDLKLNAYQLLENNKLATKIKDSEDDSILLEEYEYQKIKAAIELISGFTKDDIEFVNRILNAETVEVKEA